MSGAIVDLAGKPFTSAAPVRRARAGVPGPDGTTTYGGIQLPISCDVHRDAS